MKSRYHAPLVCVPVLVAAVCLLAGCATLEKSANLTYQRAADVTGGSGEVDLAEPVIEVRLGKMPGRTVLGSVLNTGTQIVTTDGLPEWIMGALIDELHFAGYEIRTVHRLPWDVSRGILVRVTKLSVDQEDRGLIFYTTTAIGLSAEIWKDGRLSKTLTVSASSQDEDLDRTGGPVGASLQRTLQSAMAHLMPGIIDAL
jgi:hypothetical protein